MNRPYYYIVMLLLLIAVPMAAEQPAKEFVHGRHAIRIGWGDPWLSNVKDHVKGINFVPLENTTYLEHIQGMPAPEAHEYLIHYRMALKNSHRISTTGNIFLGYRYQLTPLIGLGIEANLLVANDCFYMVDGYRTTVNQHAENQLINLSLMPTVRFTYYRQRVLELYSALGVGYNYVTYSYATPSNWNELDVSHGMSLNATLFGVNVGGEHWYAEAELGSLCSWSFMWPQSTWGPLYGSRLLSVAFGFRF